MVQNNLPSDSESSDHYVEIIDFLLHKKINPNLNASEKHAIQVHASNYSVLNFLLVFYPHLAHCICLAQEWAALLREEETTSCSEIR